MTKKKKLILIFSIIGAVIVAAVATVLVIVLTKKKPDEESKAQCVAPELVVSDDGIFWASVANATSYQYKFGDEAWAEAKEFIAFPTAEGEYTLYMKALDADGTDGKIAEFSFSVTKMTVSCEQIDNALQFEGERIYFSVNGMEEGALGEGNILDFSNDETGNTYTVQYYAKGGYWSSAEKTYYLDSAKESKTLTTTQMLSMPMLTVNEAGTHLVWTASDNAVSYAVTVDGATSTVAADNATVAFPMTEGAHTISVQAVGDGTTWFSSQVAKYEMTTRREAVPAITYEKATNTVAWDDGYADKMQLATDGATYAPLTQTSISAQDGMSLKIAAYYAEAEKTYYLESKPVSFATRAVTTPTFNRDGYITWNPDDEESAKKYYVSVVEETESAEYALADKNVCNITSLAAGNYKFAVYAADYVNETENAVVFYLPGESEEIRFSVLAKPTLSYTYGKLLWEVDSLASAYEYRVDGTGDWETATESGVLRTRDMARYEVRAIGSNEAGRYSLTSSASSLLFDPNLETTDLGATDLALFDNEQYAETVASATTGNATKTGAVTIISSADDTTDEAEKAILAGASGGVVKVTAGKASPRVQAHWGNSDGAQFTLFQPLSLEKDKRLVFRVYVVPNTAWQTAYAYNYSREYLNAKGRTIDEYGNTYAYFDEENNLVGYQSNSNKLVDGTGAEIGTIDTKSYIATVTATGAKTKARTVYGILDDNDNLLGVADENGTVKNGETTVGTLNANGELVDGSGNVLSTDAVRKTNNVAGNFYFGATGSNTAGTAIRNQETTFTNAKNNAVTVGEWTEISVDLSNYVSILSNIQTVYMHFSANGQAGDTFYIDEIRYEDIPPLPVPEYLQKDGDMGAVTYRVGKPSWMDPVAMTEGTDSVGKYVEYSWDGNSSWGIDALTFNFNGLTLNEGDKVYLHTYTPDGCRWPEILVNGDNVNYLTQGQTEEKAVFTATETTTLDTLVIRPQAYSNGYEFSIRIYGVYVVRAE